MRSLPKNGKLRSSKDLGELGVAFHLWEDTKKRGEMAQLEKSPAPEFHAQSPHGEETNSCKLFFDAHISATVLVCTSPTKK